MTWGICIWCGLWQELSRAGLCHQCRNADVKK
jgi:hypothetical protein